MVILLTLVPLLAAMLVGVGVCFHILKRKSLAQAVCIQQATKMQNDLKQTLLKLLHLNPHATSLRAQRLSADNAVKVALASGNALVIAAARARQLAIVLQQTALRAQQQALLAQAERERIAGQRDLRQRVSRLANAPVQSQVYYSRALAVAPRPPTSLSPNYEPIPLFTLAQQQRFRFQVNLLAEFPPVALGAEPVQTTECSVSLEEKDDQWDIRILAAKAL